MSGPIGTEIIPTRRMLNAIHAEQHALERYGQRLTEADAASMVVQIQTGGAFNLGRKAKRITIWFVYWLSAGKIVPVYYDNKTKQIATVLPRDRFEAAMRSPPQTTALAEPPDHG